ncbi:DUF6879 family protein [Streptomyces sp. NPDC001820]|uniref:DUF6879 family protein n=1 Tax=Streptomyces sp. NPDC001820 TaxID=3364613 RepID=UPI00368269FF
MAPSSATAASGSLATTVRRESVPDFWLFDSTDTAVLEYDETGAFLGAEVLDAGRASEFAEYREMALAHSEPFTDWWAKHGK